jgi:hypothetical protein
MSDNIEKVLQNEEKVDLIVKKAERLHNMTDEIKKNVPCFSTQASKMKKQAFWRRNKCRLAIGAIIVAACASLFFII